VLFLFCVLKDVVRFQFDAPLLVSVELLVCDVLRATVFHCS
jgi:hypothetical protein